MDLRQRQIPERERAVALPRYYEACEEILDYLAGGDPQRVRLRQAMRSRFGAQRDSKQPSTDHSGLVETERGEQIRLGLYEERCAPLLRSFSEQLAVLYSADDLRRVYLRPDGSEDTETAKLLQRLHSDAGLAARLDKLDIWLVSLRSACVLVRWCEPRQSLSYDLVPPHLVRVDPDPEWPCDPQLARAVAYSVGSADEPTWSVWSNPRGPSASRFVRSRIGEPFSDPGALPSGEQAPNPLTADPLIWSPLVWAWDEPPEDGVRLPPLTELSRDNLETDVQLSWIAMLGILETFGVPVARGDVNSPGSLGPTALWKFTNEAGGLEFARPGADITGALKVLEQLLQTSALLRHLTPDSVSTDRPSIQTGVAKLIEQAPLAEARARRCLMADQFERWLFATERAVLAAYAPPEYQIPADTELVMHWGELRVPRDRGAQLVELAQALKLALISPTDAIAEFWGVTQEEAARKREEIRADGGTTPTAAPETATEPTPPEPATGDDDVPSPENEPGV